MRSYVLRLRRIAAMAAVLAIAAFTLCLAAANEMIDARMESTVVQAEAAAAIISASQLLNGGSLLTESTTPRSDETENLATTIPSKTFEHIVPILRWLVAQPETHAQVYGRNGVLLVDTTGSPSPGQVGIGSDRPSERDEAGTTTLRSFWVGAVCWALCGDLPAHGRTGAIAPVSSGFVKPARLVVESNVLMTTVVTPILLNGTQVGVVILSTPMGF